MSDIAHYLAQTSQTETPVETIETTQSKDPIVHTVLDINDDGVVDFKDLAIVFATMLLGHFVFKNILKK